MNSLDRRLEQSRNQFVEAMNGAKSATDEALEEFLKMSHESKVYARYARMYAYKMQKAFEDLGRAPSLMVNSERDKPIDERARPLDYGMFDENDGMSEPQRRMWTARDNYDMREGK